MKTVNATDLKNRLGRVLALAALEPVAITRHGRVVARLVPAQGEPRGAHTRKRSWMRSDEERLINLCVRGDFRPSRWLRAGDARTLAGIAVMLASQPEFDRQRMLVLAEALYPGMSEPAAFQRWLANSPVQAARFLPMLRTRVRRRAPSKSEAKEPASPR